MSRAGQTEGDSGGGRLVNWVSVEAPNGLRNFNLMLGDITQCHEAVIVVPTHSNTRVPVSGEVLEAMRQAHAVDFSNQKPVVVPE